LNSPARHRLIQTATRWAALLAALTVAACGVQHVEHAPDTAELPRPAGAKVVLSLPGPSDVDSSLPQRYRYMILSGPDQRSPESFLRSEVRTMREQGWRVEQAWTLKGLRGRVIAVSPTTRGATIELDRNDDRHDIYAAIRIVNRHASLGQLTDGDPRERHQGKIAAALRSGAPVLDILLGNGSASPIR
jgi:hypothetical protein